ncbi:MAG: Rne/Rng family ribonuclease [Bacteroidales bacterium]
MNKELIVDSSAQEVIIALVEDKQLVELHKEKSNTLHAVGDVFLGRVKKIMPGLNAAFIDVGSEKEGFLHFLDLGPQIQLLNKFTNCALSGDLAQLNISEYKLKEEGSKAAKITSVLKQNQSILVQVTKEPISTKGPRLNSEISFAGRYLVLVPLSNRISISQKIKNPEERSRLRNLIQSIRPKNFGVIIRTVAEGRSVAELDNDLNSLFRKWEQIKNHLHKASVPMKVFSEMDKTVSLLRDFLNKDFNQVVTNDEDLFEEIKGYIAQIAPDKKDIVKLYKNNKELIFDHYGISKQIKASFGKVVPIKRGGAYLVVEHTEAMHVIDVNSGHRVNAEQSQEINSLEVNLEAAAEVAHQVRLRDMGGIVIVDFIDQREAQNRKTLFDAMVKFMENDPSKHTVLPPTKFGLIQITRQRVRPQTQVNVLETCPACGGTGEIKPSICVVDEIEQNIEYLVKDVNIRGFSIALNPYIYAYMVRNVHKMQIKWWFNYHRWIKLRECTSFHFLEYKFWNKNGEEIQL